MAVNSQVLLLFPSCLDKHSHSPSKAVLLPSKFLPGLLWPTAGAPRHAPPPRADLFSQPVMVFHFSPLPLISILIFIFVHIVLYPRLAWCLLTASLHWYSGGSGPPPPGFWDYRNSPPYLSSVASSVSTTLWSLGDWPWHPRTAASSAFWAAPLGE